MRIGNFQYLGRNIKDILATKTSLPGEYCLFLWYNKQGTETIFWTCSVELFRIFPRTDYSIFLKLGMELWGQKGVKNEFWGSFLKTPLIWFIFLVKKDIMVQHICAKSRKMLFLRYGVRRGQNRVFLDIFLLFGWFKLKSSVIQTKRALNVFLAAKAALDFTLLVS